jgi:hypothetical protein
MADWANEEGAGNITGNILGQSCYNCSIEHSSLPFPHEAMIDSKLIGSTE